MTKDVAVETIELLKKDRSYPMMWSPDTHRLYAEAVKVFLASSPGEDEFAQVLSHAPVTARILYIMWTTPPPKRSDALGTLE